MYGGNYNLVSHMRANLKNSRKRTDIAMEMVPGRMRIGSLNLKC